MPATLTTAGLQIQTYDEILAELIARVRTALGANVNTSLQSVLGNLLRIQAEFEAVNQELLLAVYESFDPNSAEGAALDARLALTGTTRRGGTRSQILSAQFSGLAATAIANGRRVRLIQTQTVWEVVGGPYVIGGGGTVVGRVQSVVDGPIEAVATASSGWTILDVVAGWTAFESLVDAVPGRLAETAKEVRQRRRGDLFRAADGPLAAIKAAVANVVGLTSVNVYQNLGLTPDSDGIPGKSVNVVVDGVAYDDQDVIDAIWSRLPPGCDAYGTDVSGTAVDAEGTPQTVRFDRVDAIDVWVRATLTTSTSETIYPPNGDTAVEDAILAYANANHPVGRDVLPVFLVGAVTAEGIPGIDAILVELSTDGITYSAAKLSIGIRQRAVFDSTRTTVVRI